MTSQEVFDKVTVHLLTQNKKSTVLVDRPESVFLEGPAFIEHCRYRGVDGRSCAVGCIIPDDLYDPLIEGYSIVSQQLTMLLEKCGLTEHLVLLKGLQHIHDCYSVHEWNYALKKVAKEYSLNTDCLDKKYDKATNI